jgi:endonuclease YncB( thermonuclease family)
LGVLIGGIVGWALLNPGQVQQGLIQFVDASRTANDRTGPGNVGCTSPAVLDGDTLRCPSGRIRLASIDAPELPGHCRPGRDCTPGDPYASTENLRKLIAGNEVACMQTDTDRYGRAVARCTVGGVDLSCAQVEGGFAVRRYGLLMCY